jgi:hypothetical protein
MYRSYEDPFKLQDLLDEKRREYSSRMEAGEDVEVLMDLAIEINDLEQRVNFAWQDDEYDAEYVD